MLDSIKKNYKNINVNFQLLGICQIKKLENFIP